MDFRFLQYCAGQIDADGSISMYNKSRLPFIAIEKAAKGRHVLDMICEHFGGKVYQSAMQRGKFQAKFMWCLRGASAIDIIKQLIPFLKTKKRLQAEIVSRWKSSFGAFTIRKGGRTWSNLRVQEMEAIIQRSAPTILKYSKRNEPCQGFTVTKDVVSSRDLHRDLQLAKSGADPPCGRLHPSYIAGFFDGEGHIKTSKASLYVTISQKDPTILEAIRCTYGGSICHEKGRSNNCLTFCAKSAKAFLLAIRADVFEKRDQLELALQLSKDNWEELGPKMKAMRGCQL